jgi:Tol biopolymer transport system component
MAGYPKWSNDSKYVYFNTIDTGEPALFRVRVADGKEEKIADVPFRVTGIYWSWSGLTPDGSLLVLRERDNLDVYALALSSQ